MKTEAELNERPFNPWRIPISPSARSLVGDAVRSVEEFEQREGLRRRKRRAADQRQFEQTVSAVVCELAHHYVTGSLSALYISRSKNAPQNRYARAFGKTLPDILDRLAAIGWIDQEIGEKSLSDPSRSRRTAIYAGRKLRTYLERAKLTIHDFGLNPAEEVIILRRGKEDYWDTKENIDYSDNSATRRYRKQVREINAWLARGDIDWTEGDASNRRLKRIFSQGHFDSGGRLFGGIWQSLSKEDRSQSIFIDGESICELDYDQMAARILYGLVGAVPPEGDLYAIPGLEGHRKGVKKLFNAMLFATRRLAKFPRDTRSLFSEGMTVGTTMSLICQHHEPLRPLFFTGIGHKAQFIESEIMVRVLLALRDHKVTALPIHDAVLVPKTAQKIAKDVMLSCFQSRVGVEGSVSLAG